MIRRLTALGCTLFWMSAGLLAFQPPTTGGDTGYVPITSLPPGQEIPAAPYLLTAYAVIWVGVLFYAWSIWKRLGKVEQEMRALEQRRK